MLQILPRSKTPSGAAYLERGEGEETLVLIHGVGMRIEAGGRRSTGWRANFV